MKCEICGKEIEFESPFNSFCNICDKNICFKCAHTDNFTGSAWGKICDICWEAGDDIMNKLTDLDLDYIDKKDELISSWKEICGKE